LTKKPKAALHQGRCERFALHATSRFQGTTSSGDPVVQGQLVLNRFKKTAASLSAGNISGPISPSSMDRRKPLRVRPRDRKPTAASSRFPMAGPLTDSRRQPNLRLSLGPIFAARVGLGFWSFQEKEIRLTIAENLPDSKPSEPRRPATNVPAEQAPIASDSNRFRRSRRECRLKP